MPGSRSILVEAVAVVVAVEFTERQISQLQHSTQRTIVFKITGLRHASSGRPSRQKAREQQTRADSTCTICTYHMLVRNAEVCKRIARRVDEARLIRAVAGAAAAQTDRRHTRRQVDSAIARRTQELLPLIKNQPVLERLLNA